MKLQALRLNLGWSLAQLAREASVGVATVSRAEKGETISAASAKKLADALTKGYNREILVTEIEALVIE